MCKSAKAERQAPPQHVQIILAGGVRVAAMTGLVRRELSDAGRTVLSTRHGAVVHYEADTSDLDNSDLVGLLQLLARLGVGFARDYTQMWSPADVVAELIDRGTEFSNPWACGFDGQVWHVKPYPWSGA